MKKKQKHIGAYRLHLFAIMALVAIMGFSMAGCESPAGGDSELTGTVSIIGTAATGQTLTADTAALNGSGTIDYQWKRNSTSGGTSTGGGTGTVVGENSSTYVVQVEDIGSTITVTVTRTGNTGSITSEPTAAVIDARPALSGTVIITGDAEVGETLTADTTGLGGEGTITYQWNRNFTEGETTSIGTNSDTYTVQPEDTDLTITVTVTRRGNSGSVTSEPTETVVDLRPALTGTVVITGIAAAGETLTAGISGLGGEGAISYQWKRNSTGGGTTTNIGTNSSTYVIQIDDAGSTITVTVTRAGNSASVTSEPTATVEGFPALTGTVVITGTPMVGATLTADTSGLSGEGTIAYQWKRNGTNNIGTNSSTYTVQAADEGSTITVTVTRNDRSLSVTSDPTATVTKLGLPQSIRASTTKNWYVVGDAGLDLSTITVEAVYGGGDTEFIPNDMVTFGTLNTASAGGRNVTITYGGHSTTLSVTVYAITKIEVAVPTPIKFAVGDPLDNSVLGKITVTATYGNNETENVTGRITLANISGYSSTVGSKELTVTYRTASAKFTVGVYATVTFNPNGGNWSGSTLNRTVETLGDSAVTQTDPVRADYAFDGWYTAASGGTKVDFPRIITANTIVYAQWRYIVTFNPNGGTLDGSTANKTVEVVENATVANPGNPTRRFYSFVNWYTAQTGGNVYNFATSVTASITLYARWNAIPFTSIADITEYLGTVPANTADTPAPLPAQFDLGIMANATSNWQLLLGAINAAGKFVDLDLSACTIEGGASTIFDPSSSVATGKDKIVTIALPNIAQSIPDAANTSASAFNNFTVLTSFSAGTAFRTIGNYAFYQRTTLTMATLPTGITSIGNYAFGNCTNLALTTLPTGLISIGGSAFGNCRNLALTALPTGVTTINTYVFSGCSGLRQFTLHNDITSIGASAFYNCTNLALTALPTGVTTISNNAFQLCSGLGQLTLHNGITSIGSSAFEGCTNLALTALPTNLISIDTSAFRFCEKLALTALPTGVTKISNYVFAGCTSLSQFTLHAGIVSIGAGSFDGCTNLARVVFSGTIPTPYGETFNLAFLGDLRAKYIATGGGRGTYTTTAPVSSTSVWMKQ